MKTVYTLYRWTVDGGTAEDDQPQFPTVADAQTAAGYPDPDVWQAWPSGNVGLRADVAREMGYVHGQPYCISPDQVAETDAERIQLAIDCGLSYGSIDGDHHKMWTIDQMLRILAGDRYGQLITDYRDGADGPETYSWDTGVAP